jgi:hypothetical protein
MTVHLTLTSGSHEVLRLVNDFAHGMGCAVEALSAEGSRQIRIEVPDVGHALVELLTHVALSATKAGIEITEPLCQVTCRHTGAASEVNLAFRVTEFSIDTTAGPRV